MNCTVHCMNSVQNGLLRAQAVPVVGPFVVSPVKLSISLVQMIMGLVGTIFFGMLTFVFCCSNCCALKAKASFNHIQMGGKGFMHSLLNILSLGCLGKSFIRDEEASRI